MTREEAISVLNMVEAHGLADEAKKEAIKALEQPCEDCVSRQSMLDAITEIDDNTNMDIYTNEVREIIKDLPSVTPTRKTGHWIFHSNYDAMECDKCGRAYSEYDYNAFNYCPNCGAEMESEE